MLLKMHPEPKGINAYANRKSAFPGFAVAANRCDKAPGL